MVPVSPRAGQTELPPEDLRSRSRSVSAVGIIVIAYMRVGLSWRIGVRGLVRGLGEGKMNLVGGRKEGRG